MPDRSLTHRLLAYTAWADDVMLESAARLSERELSATRDTLFGSISGTFDHVLVVAEVFRAHLEGRTHPHTARHRDAALPFTEIAQRLRSMDEHNAAMARRCTAAELAEVITFDFVDGGAGRMTREDIFLHLANHATYHRGFISTLLFPLNPSGVASDLTVFLRDVWPDAAADVEETTR